jgi:hypothetical protein
MSIDPRILEARKNPRRTEKRCSVCHQTKPLYSFHLGGSTIDGRSASCKECANARTRAWISSETPRLKLTVSAKTCPACCVERSASQYHKCRSRPDGLQTYCKECQARCSAGGSVAGIRRSLGLPTTHKRRVASLRREAGA